MKTNLSKLENESIYILRQAYKSIPNMKYPAKAIIKNVIKLKILGDIKFTFSCLYFEE